MIAIIIAVLAVLYALSKLFSGETLSPLETPAAAATVTRTDWTPQTLAAFNGSDEKRIFIAVRGTVYDVTAGSLFYGPGGPYANFAGRDALRGLALNSFDIECLTDLDKPIDTLEGLLQEEILALDGWESLFSSKYPVVGQLRNPNQK